MTQKYSLLAVVGILLVSCLGQDAPTGPSFEEQLKKDIVAIDAFLATNAISVLKDSSGTRYAVTKIGTGAKPVANGIAYVSVKGKIMSTGSVFADSKDAFVKITLSNPLLPCWQIVLPKINKGSSVTIYSPSGLAYGTGGSSDGSVAANTNVIFDLKLFDEVEQFKTDTTAIETYLATNNITTAITDPSGLRYVVTVLGTGVKPTATSTITFNYDGKFLTTGTSFDKSSAPATSALSGLIKGFQIGMPLLPAGTKATFYIPSSLGYGPTIDSSGKIPGNSNLIFDVELVSTN